MDRRTFCAALAAAVADAPRVSRAVEPDDTAAAGRIRLAAAWRGLANDSPQRVGVLAIDWDGRRSAIESDERVPSRAHGLLAEPDGGFVAVAFRPGDWLWRFDAHGRVVRRVSTRDEPGDRRFSGHVIAHPGSDVLLATEYDARDGEALVGVRDRVTLAKLDEWRLGGLDAHQLLADGDDAVVVAIGGLPRTADGRKRDLDRMDASLLRLDARRGTATGRWRLPDARLGLRHLAWSLPGDGPRRLGIALQAEHDDPARRARAPVLALWDGESLSLPESEGEGGGYAGDVVAVPGGFVVSCQPAGVALRWSRERPARTEPIARMREACALAASAVDGGVLVAGALGAGRWHPMRPAAMLRWPEPIALDNHWVALAAG